MIRGVLFDLDGTVYLGEQEVPGAAGFVARARDAGMACLFVTNRASRTPETVCAQLQGHGIDCNKDDVLTSAQATASYLEPGSSVYGIGESGLHAAFKEAGLTTTEDGPDYVVVSFDRQFTYAKLKTACRLIGDGATFVATNPDKGMKTEEGLVPGTGALVAAVAAACGQAPIVIGKPEGWIIEMALDRLNLPAADVILVGDNLETDMPAGAKAGVRTVLILTGISSRADIADAAAAPTWVVANYEELNRLVFDELRKEDKHG